MASQNTTTAHLEGLDQAPSNSSLPQPSASEPFAFAMLLKPEYVSVIVSALAIIWLGAHGSLRRPPSAAAAKPKNGKKQPKEEKFQEGLAASDAILFPIVAAILLMSLYYLIEWLQDPTILSKIMRGYMSLMAVISLARLSGDALDILTSLIFPTTWADRSGKVYHIDPDRRCQYLVDAATGEEVIVPSKITPLPGFLSSRVLSTSSRQLLWGIRHLYTEEWTVRFAMHGFFFFKFNIKLNDILGFLVSLPVAIAYHYTGWNLFSNVLSTAMCYASFLMLSPTSVGIGTLVLWGLFVYDVVMVFYTPYMITVAQKLDAPIKLVFEGPSGSSMLGLGDIVVPGMLMGIALRFDLFQFYKKQIKLETVELATELIDDSTGRTVTTTQAQHRRVKSPYVDTRGQWGNRFWSTKVGSLVPVKEATEALAATAFPKPYFYASIAGYTAGMVVTLTMLLVFRHGQPALLYLVPGVTGAIWLTALIRGEIKDVWGYTEDGSIDTEDVIVDVDGSGRVVEKKEGEKLDGEGEEQLMEGEVAKKDKKQEKEGDYDVFLFSITAPRFALKVD